MYIMQGTQVQLVRYLVEWLKLGMDSESRTRREYCTNQEHLDLVKARLDTQKIEYTIMPQSTDGVEWLDGLELTYDEIYSGFPDRAIEMGEVGFGYYRESLDLKQTVVKMDIELITLGQMCTDLELKVLEMEAVK